MHRDSPGWGDDGREGPDGRGGRDEVAWLAWRYLLDELDPAAAAAFEERLGHDEDAAACLSRSVVLLSAVDAAVRPGGRVVAAATAGRRRRRLVAGLAAVAASLGLVGLLGIGQWLERPGPSGDASELVSIWREAAGDAAVEGEPVGMEDDAPPAGDDVPDWLMAAVALDAPAADDEILEN